MKKLMMVAALVVLVATVGIAKHHVTVDVGDDSEPLNVDDVFFWTNTTDGSCTVTMKESGILTQNSFTVPAHSGSQATVSHTASGGEHKYAFACKKLGKKHPLDNPKIIINTK